MNYEAATDKQLITIVNYDREVPIELLEGVVMEMLHRNLWKNLIFHELRYYRTNLDDDEINQMGNIAIWKALKGFNNKAAFSYLCRKAITNHMNNHFTIENAQKRKLNKAPSLDAQDWLLDVIPSETNVEKYVLMKVHFESQLEKLTPLQREAVIGFKNGYGTADIAKRLGKTRQAVEKAFHRAVEKMGGERINLKQGTEKFRRKAI